MTDDGSVRSGGDCFQAALEVMLAWPNSKLIHGLPRITAEGEHFGKRHWHAWVEIIHPEHGPMVLDFSNGKQTAMSKDLYYQSGDIEQVFTYTFARAGTNARRTGHMGPWVPGWEDMEHPDFKGLEA